MDMNMDADLIAAMRADGLFSDAQLAEITGTPLPPVVEQPVEPPVPHGWSEIEADEGVSEVVTDVREIIEGTDTITPLATVSFEEPEFEPIEETVEELLRDEPIELGAEVADEVAAALALDERRGELYASQSNTTSVTSLTSESDPGAEPVAITASKSARKKASGKAAPSTPRTPRASYASNGARAVAIAGSTIELNVGSGVTVETQALVDGINAVKIGEKAINLLEATFKGSKPSVYTQIGLKQLNDAGKLTIGDLVKRYIAGGDGRAYDDGTARSQAQQIHSLFRSFGLIKANNEADLNNFFVRRLFDAPTPAPTPTV